LNVGRHRTDEGRHGMPAFFIGTPRNRMQRPDTLATPLPSFLAARESVAFAAPCTISVCFGADLLSLAGAS
jgi:hypothetical protein